MKTVKRTTAFILVIIMTLAMPAYPGHQTSVEDRTVYAAAGDHEINLASVSTDVTVKSSGGSIWVNTKSALNSDFKRIGSLTDSRVILHGSLNTTSGKILVESDVNNSTTPVNIVLSNAAINNTEMGAANDPKSAFKIINSTVNLMLREGSKNYITEAALCGSVIEIAGKSNLTITGAGFLSAVMSHDVSNGSAIGGGYNTSGIIETGNITIGGGADIYASVYLGATIGGGCSKFTGGGIKTGKITIVDADIEAYSKNGTVIGGGFAYSPDSTINTGDINIKNSEIFSTTDYSGSSSATIGGGTTNGNNSHINTGTIRITDSDVTAYGNLGAGVGGGFGLGSTSSIRTGEITILNSRVVASGSGSGAGIGGGYLMGMSAYLETDKISIDGSAISGYSSNGAGIGGGFIAGINAEMKTGKISIDDTKMIATTGLGAAIGGGYATNLAKITTGDIIISGSNIDAKNNVAGAAIGGGNLADLNECAMTTGAIEISGSLVKANTFKEGVGIGGGNVPNSDSKLSLGPIILEGDFISAYAFDGQDIGTGLVNGTVKHAAGVFISGGSIYASNDKISPAPQSGDGRLVYQVTVPTKAGIGGKEITVDLGSRTYSATAVSDHEHGTMHGDTIAAYIYLPAGTYTKEDLSVGSFSAEVVVAASPTGKQNIVQYIEPPFTDVQTAFWGKAAVEYVYQNDLMKGASDTLFKPNDPMLRSMFVTVIGRLDGQDDGGVSTAFVDVPSGSYYASHVNWASENNIVNGLSETRFAPGNKITREQVATIIVRYAEYLGIPLTTAGFSGYSDFNQASNYAKDSIMKAQVAGIMTGTPGGKFEPKKNISRAEAAQMLMNFSENTL